MTIMGLPIRYRSWSILQVVAVVVYYTGEVSSEVSQGCVGSRLNLTCKESKFIQVTAVVLGDSKCEGGMCCIKDDDCIADANASHRADVRRRCDNEQNCTIDVLKERFSCGLLRRSRDNDFEHISYICRDGPLKIAQDCVGSRLNLRCSESKVIKITAVVLGDSGCSGAKCCIRDGDCTHNASAHRTTDVHRRCDNKQHCNVDVLTERIPCGILGRVYPENNDFERISYICRDDPRNDTVNSTAQREESTVSNYVPDDNSDKESTTRQDHSKFAQGCVGARLNLTCDEMKFIQVKTVVLGDSECEEISCCIKDDDCAADANASHRADVRGKCDNEQNCTIDVLKEEISCGLLRRSRDNDFEHISYICRDGPLKIAQECVGSQLGLRCPELKVIQITSVVLGDTSCTGSSCCIRDNDCTHNASEHHRTSVRSRCDNRQSCTVNVFKGGVNCGWFGDWSDNDFERITYDCIDDPRNDTMNSNAEREESTEGDRDSDGTSDEELTTSQDHSTTERDESTEGQNVHHHDDVSSEAESTTNQDDSKTLPVVLVIVFLVILLGVVVTVVIVYRRKQGGQHGQDGQVKMFPSGDQVDEIDHLQNEYGIDTDESHRTREDEDNPPLSLSMTDGAAAVYSEVVSKDDYQGNTIAKDEAKSKAAIQQVHTAGPAVYAAVNKPSAATATSSAIEMDLVGGKGSANMGDECLQNQIHSLATTDVDDTYENGTSLEMSTQVVAGIGSKSPSPIDDGCQIVVENDLYSQF